MTIQRRAANEHLQFIDSEPCILVCAAKGEVWLPRWGPKFTEAVTVLLTLMTSISTALLVTNCCMGLTSLYFLATFIMNP